MGSGSPREGGLTAMPRPSRVLVVTEDPNFVEQARETLIGDGANVVACLGPVQSECLLDSDGGCSLAARARVVIVDPPPGGFFRRYEQHVAADVYAERLVRFHPGLFVLLAGDGEVGIGRGGVAHARDRSGAVAIAHDLVRPRSLDENVSCYSRAKGDPR